MRINAGIKCINKAIKTSGNEYSTKTSKERRLIKAIYKITIALGNH